MLPCSGWAKPDGEPFQRIVRSGSVGARWRGSPRVAMMSETTGDPALRSAIVCFNPFPGVEQRANPDLNMKFRERLLREYGFRISGGGVGPDGFTRAPDPEAAKFPAGLIPNRDPDTLAPQPFGYALRANACVWNSVDEMDRFVAAARDLVRKMTA